MREKGIRYTVSTEQISDAGVICDKIKLNRVLYNLVSNAFKFTPEGGAVSVVFRQESSEEGQGTYQISVKDTGIGMSEEFAAKVFDAFEEDRKRAEEAGMNGHIAKPLDLNELKKTLGALI